jgi:2-dehydro-3-deoxygluconokinase
VIYDRANSAASQMQPDDFDWERLSDARWLHLTGITPALSASCLATVRRAMEEAQQRRVPISFDLNYRAKLWTPAQAAPVLDELAAQASVIIAAERDVKLLFHLSDKPEALLPNLHARWNQATVVLTHGAGGCAAFDGGLHHAPAVPVSHPIAIGAGDAFDAGLLDALLDGKPLPEALRQANALAALKLTMPGDVVLVTRAELDALLISAAAGVVR